jgi:ABC-type uncharacterized transport system permease subunit
MGKRYKVIVKVDKDQFLRYHVNDLLSFVQFLDSKWKGWRWFNVYDDRTGDQIASYTVKRLPASRHI